MKSYIFCLLISLLSVVPTLCSAQEYSAVYDSLELYLSQRDSYFELQVAKIEQEESKLLLTDVKREQFDICYKIFNLTRSYKYDLASNYAKKAESIAIDAADNDLYCMAMACKLSSFNSGGLFVLGAELIDNINLDDVGVDARREFYYNVVRYYSDHLDYLSTSSSDLVDKTSSRLVQYADSVLALSAEKDYYWVYASAFKAFREKREEDVVAVIQDFYGQVECSNHHNAILAFLLSDAYFILDNEKLGVQYLTQSMGYDTRGAARENRSIKTMAQFLFSKGEKQFSDRLINAAFSDATFYNARHRNLEISTLLPIINQQKIEAVRHERNLVYIFSIIVTILTFAALWFLVLARRRSRMLTESATTITLQLEQLKQSHNQLIEANNIKEHYIAESLYKKNEQIEQFQQLLHKIEVKIKNKMYDDLRFVFREFNVKRERERFLFDFDIAFLKLFPNFLDEYNKLFAPEDCVVIEEGMGLPAEVRIYALIRLGIADNDRITKFLDLSINTIYTYKTKVKNKTIVPKDEFEKRIAQIKLSNLVGESFLER